MFDEIWYIFTSRENRIKRLMESRGYSREKCLEIMANQVSEDEYRAQADRVIDNNETVEEIRTQIKSYIHDPAEKRGSAIVTIKNILEEE